MSRTRDRQSAMGLLPRMEARLWKDGKTVTYRFHPTGKKPINLGTDRGQAIARVVALINNDGLEGTIARLWSIYKDSSAWEELSTRTQSDYEAYSVELLKVFGHVHADSITAPDVAKYLRVERRDAKTRANREISLLGNLVGLAIERGEAMHNPCRGGQVRRNKERPRDVLPEASDIAALIAHAQAKGGQWAIVVMAAEFAALAGPRQIEFIGMHWPQWTTDGARWKRAKQRKGVVKWESVQTSAALDSLRVRAQAIAHQNTLGAVFPTRNGNAYTPGGFRAMWGRLMREALALGLVRQRFAFHDLRAFYTSRHKATLGALPDMHASPSTTASIYERSKTSKRQAL